MMQKMWRLSLSWLLSLLLLLQIAVVAAHAKSSNLPALDDDFFNSYHNYDEIVSWFKLLAVDYNELIVFYPRIVRAFEGRDVICVRVSSPEGVKPPFKPKIFIQSLQNGRDWISTTTAMFLVHYLVTSDDPLVKKLMIELEFVFIPMANPDGYDYTWRTDRHWEKNRFKTVDAANNTFYGVSLNRNWDDHWSESDSSFDPASPKYHGTRAFSELETGAMAYFIAFDLFNVAGMLDLRAFGQEIVYPYGWTQTPSEEDVLFRQLTTEMVDLIHKEPNGTVYSTRPSNTNGLNSGTAVDWGYGDDLKQVIGTKPLSLQINLRPGPDVEAGYILPPSEIIPTANEFIPAFLHFSQVAFERLQRLQKNV